MRFAEDICALGEEEQELEILARTFDQICRKYKVVISAEDTELMKNSANGLQREMKIKRQKFGTITSFICLVTTVSSEAV
ncbi:MAG: hypothetical protein AB2693_33365 [Candidatus Thiodiazotropha sp.]